MKKCLLIAAALWSSVSWAQQKCATDLILQQRLLEHPEYAPIRALYLEQAAQQASLFSQGGPQQKTTTVKVPVVFHVILNNPKQIQLGQAAGILQRAQDQIDVLNEDFNMLNADIVKVPAPFAPVKGSLNISFGLAHRKPDGTSTSGVEIRSTTLGSFSALTNSGSDPKQGSVNGLDAWDPTRYLNVWIVDIQEAGILGFTIPPSFLSFNYTMQDLGLVIDYGAFGRQSSSITFFNPATNNLGRTMTHETGHFFELIHTFGLGPGCPGSGDIDDNIADTPPQDNSTFNSTYPGGNIPFPLTDACSPNAPGIMWMNFMDYPDDSSLVMFTAGQSNYVQSNITTGILKSITEHPELCDYPTGIAALGPEPFFNIFPNPSSGWVHFSFAAGQVPTSLLVRNLLGQVVREIPVSDVQGSVLACDLSDCRPGVYFAECTFADQTVLKKIIIE